jgi:hypothetical protein
MTVLIAELLRISATTASGRLYFANLPLG